MALTSRDRIDRLKEVVEILNSGLMLDDINLLLNEFGRPNIEYADNGGFCPSIVAVLKDIPDEVLLDMHAYVARGATNIAELSAEPTAECGLWQPDLLRIFISHSAHHKEFAGKVAKSLDAVGIQGFVAHETMEPSKLWQDQMEAALKSMHGIVALVHPEFNSSPWCQQELGWALGRQVPRLVIRLGSDPEGFVKAVQWDSFRGKDPEDVAQEIGSWALREPRFQGLVLEAAFGALRQARSYDAAGAAAKRLTSLGSLSNEQFAKLDEIWWSNDQLFNGVKPTSVMKPYYATHGRSWPPSKKD